MPPEMFLNGALSDDRLLLRPRKPEPALETGAAADESCCSTAGELLLLPPNLLVAEERALEKAVGGIEGGCQTL